MRSPRPELHLSPGIVLESLRPIFENEKISKTGHNIKYDLMVLRKAGVDLKGIAFDSMIAAHLLNLPGLGMDSLALSQLRHETIPITDLIGLSGRGRTQLTMDQVDLDVVTK